MCHFQHQTILNRRSLASFEECLRSGVFSVVSILEGNFRRERKRIRPDILPGELSIKFLRAIGCLDARRGRRRGILGDAFRVQDDGAWIAMCACPADDGVVEEGAASAFVRARNDLPNQLRKKISMDLNSNRSQENALQRAKWN